jgi:hypothetical protein
MTGYLLEIAERPRDAKQCDPAYVEEVAALRREVLRRFLDHNKQCLSIFGRYDLAIEDFLKRDNPTTIHRFLNDAHDTFWTLGHYVTALLNCHAILDDCLANLAPVNAIANVETVLRRLEHEYQIVLQIGFFGESQRVPRTRCLQCCELRLDLMQGASGAPGGRAKRRWYCTHCFELRHWV